MANPNRKKRTKEEWDKLTEQAAKNAAKRMQEKKQEQEKEKAKKLAEGRARYNAAQEKNPSKKITAAQAKEAFSLPLPSATAAKKQETKTAAKKAAADFNAPLAQMSRNSTSWSILEQGKDAAKKARWPEKAIGKMTVKQNALHQKNVEIAKPYDITFDAQKGVWRGGDSYGEWKGAQVYDAKKALPLPGSTATDMVAGARKVRETAGQFQPNPAVPAAQVAENRAKGAQRAKETLMWPVHQTMAAIGGVSGSLYDTANMALETTGIDKFLPDAVKNWVTKNAQLGHGVQEQVRAVNYERGGKLGGAVGDLAQLGVEMLGQYALAAATGGSTAGAQLGAKTGTVSKALEAVAKSPNFWYSFVRTAGPEYEEAKANGASGPQAASAAILSALGQAGVEMGGGVETLAGKAAGGVKGAVKSMLEEGGEEAVQDLISGLAHKGVYDKGRGWFGSGDSGAVVNPQRMAGEFAMGALGASLPVGVNALMRRGKTYSLPLPQDSAKAGSNPAATNPQGLPLPTSFPEQAKTQTVGLPTSFPETGKAKGLPTEISYEAQIDGVFNGSLSTDRSVTIGKTPEILQSLGAPNLPLTMTQNTARKIAYPEGYLGGKHNLGIPALKSLPQQLDNPLAVLQSKTQPDSFVVLTEWNDTNGNPVVAAVHMNKRGVIEDVNALASAYGKRNLESLLGENRENVIYTKENKSIDQILDNRLQLPELLSDDTLVAYSIAQNEGKNKGNPQAGAEVKAQEIPDPGVLRQTPWQEGETKPRLGGEHETRPETARRLTQEEEYEIGKQLDDYLEQQEALRDKLESDLAAARRVLPTPGSEARIRELQSGFEDVNRTLAAMEKNRAQFAQAEETARALGAKFEIADIGEANGKYENGTITMNPYTENPARQVLVHELTHHIETSGQYDALQSRVLEFIGQDMQTDVNAMLEAVTHDYAARGVTLTQDGARRELVAKFCEEKLFTDEKSIERLARTEPGLFQRIREWISDTIAKLRGTRQENALREMERLYEKAARSTGEQAGYQGAQYSIETDANGDKFVDVTDDILEGKTEKDHAQILRDIIRNKFGNIIQANGQIFAVNSKTSSEWRRSKSASSLYQKNNSAYLDKIRVFNNADELMSASHDYVGEGLKHPRKDRFVEFARGKVNYRVGNNGYTADIVVGIGIDGRADLYDIVNIRDKKITEARILPVTEELTSSPIGGASVNISIPQTGQDGNPSGQNPAPKFKGIAKQREYREAVEQGRMSDAQAMLDAKARERGYSADEDWRMSHRAPNSTDGYSARMDDLSPMFGEDIYSRDALQYFGTGERSDRAALAAIQKARRNPEATITVYRAVPSNVQDTHIRNGDWVALTPEYAREHGERTLDGDYRIIRETVAAGELYGNGDSIHEFGYDNGRNEVYRNAVGNAKQTGITYDDFGKLIPLSQRFDETNPDRRYSMGMTFGQLRDSVNGALGQQGTDMTLPDTDGMRGLLDAWDAKRQAEQQAEETRKGLTLTRRDMEMAQAAARMGMDSQRWEQADNPEQAYIYGGTLRDVREADRPIREFMAERQAALQGDAQQAAEWLAEFAKDKWTGFQYQRETMERNIRDIFGAGHRETADAIIREYITPVHKAVADGNRLKNDYRARVKALKLNQHESALVQMMLENETGAVNEYIANNHIQITPELDGKLQNAVQEFRAIYNELYTQINAALLLGGQEPAPFRKNYAPHFRKDKPDTMLGKIRFALGLGKDSSLNLPTDLAGITDEFRPGKKWFGNLLQREGEITDFDAVAGFDGYIETAADIITLTDSIQKLRALEDAVRYTFSDEGVRDQIDAIRANDELDALEQRRQMEELYSNNPSTAQQLIANLKNQQQMGMGRFVTELRRYTDNLAGKKSREDRAMEDMLNRQIYTVAKNMEGRTAANMIALNPGSWLTNLIPITQASGEVSAGNLLAGMRDTVKAFVKDDGFADASDFLTNRTGADRLDKTITQRVGDAAGAGMEFFDRIASQTIVRARARQNMQSGMSFEEAIADADSFAAGLMADRSKGAQPTIFNATNPLTKTVTMFQIEVNNQLSYLFKDMPQAQAQKGAAAVAWAYTKVFAGAYLYNLVYKQLTGRDAAFDPIGWIMEAFGIGEDDEEERTGFDVAESLGKNVAENLPFVGGLLGGGRVPVSSAIPNPFTIWDAAKSDASRAKKGQEIGKELLKPAAYLLPPFGGGAVKRAVEGAQAVRQGGVYGMDNKGNRMLKFPVYGQGAKDYAQAVLFGRYSLPTGREYIDSGFQGGLNAKNTAIYERLAQGGTDPQKAYEAIRAVTGAKAPEDGSLTAAQAKREAIMALDLTPEEKVELNRALVGGDDLVSFQDRDSFQITNTVSASNQPAAFALMREQGMDAAQAKKYAELVDDQGATYTLGKDQKITKTYEDGRQEERLLYTKDGKAARLKKAYETIQADESLTDGQKNGVVRAVVLSKLGKKYAGEYAEEFIGGIGVEQLIDAQAAYEDISEDVKKDTTIHENNRSEYVRLRFADYLENTGLDFLRRESLWYFQSHDESEFKEPWSEIIRKTTPSDEEERTRKQSALRGLQDSGMDESLFKVIKAGMGRVYADKDANGETIDGSAKKKKIAYLNKWEGLTDEQKDLIMKACGYKYGMGEKPKKGKSSGLKFPYALPTSFKLDSLPTAF